MSQDSTDAADGAPIETGRVVYDGEGNPLGVISGFTSEGFEVSITEEFEEVDADGTAEVAPPDTESEQARKTNQEDLRTADEEQQPGQEFGEGYLMWRCDDCGEMGELDDGMPEECPNCGAEKEAIYEWRED